MEKAIYSRLKKINKYDIIVIYILGVKLLKGLDVYDVK